MDWTTVWVVMGALVAYLIVRQIRFVRPAQATRYLAAGAPVIDVRSPEEYQAGHVPGALNIPLNELQGEVARRFPRHDQPLLLHCLAGTRSGLGRRVLRRMGYTHVFNLGSYARARRIVAAAGRPEGD